MTTVRSSEILVEGGEGVPEEVAAQIRQLREQLGGGGGIGGGAGFGLQAGTIEAVDGNTITLNTQQGPLEIAVGDETTIQMTTEVPMSDLETGMTVTVAGERDEDGNFTAGNIVVLPEGAEGLPFGGFRGGRETFRAAASVGEVWAASRAVLSLNSFQVPSLSRKDGMGAR